MRTQNFTEDLEGLSPSTAKNAKNVLLLFTMIVDNLSSNLMSDKHVAFGMFGVVLLIMNCYLGLRSLKKYIRIKPH